MNNSRPKKSTAAGDGMVHPEVLYRLAAIARQLGWGERSIRKARREGLPIHKCGRCSYVYGADAIAYVRGQVAGEDSP